MAYEQPDFLIGFLKADVDLSSLTTGYNVGVDLVVATNSAGSGMGKPAVKLPTAGGLIVGVTQNNPGIGQAATICNTGVTMAKMSGTGVLGDLLMVDANGFFLKATTGNIAVARAIESYQAGATSTILLGTFGKQ